MSKNEEKSIVKTLESISFSNEIILVDNDSSDQTVEIAKEHKAQIYERNLDNDFSRQRNFGLEKAKGDWVLFIDADEVLSQELTDEIKKIITNESSSKSAYYLKRRDFWWGRELRYGEVKKVRQEGLIRLVKKGSGQWQGLVHERFVITGQTGRLRGFINHYPHQTISSFLSDINFYSTLRAKELVQQKKRAFIITILLYPLGKFIHTYFIQLGFLDGAPGFTYAFLMSFHSFLVRAKQYQYLHLE